jgi:hypothetical protein
MADNTNARTTRELETRALTERPKQWMQPELLPEPDKEAGFAYRWIRVATLNNSDPSNLASNLRQGWEPVTMSEQPKFRLLADPHSRFKDNIEVGGLLLCKIPAEFMEQRAQHFANITSQQAEAVDNNLMRQSDSRMPIFKERSSKVTFGKGT